MKLREVGGRGGGVTFNDIVLNGLIYALPVEIEDLTALIKRIYAIKTIQISNYRKKTEHC